MDNSKISAREKFSYGLASGGGNIISQVLGTFLTAYLTDSVGIAAAAVGTMLLLVRILDAASDILMGSIVDRTNTRWGKARPWLLISAPLILVALVLMFNVPESFSGTAKLVYTYLAYIFLNCVCYTMLMVAHTALMPRMTLDGQERQKMASINQIVNQVCGLTVTTFMAGLVVKYGWRTTTIIYGIATAVLILIGFFGTKERLGEVDGVQKKKESVPLKVALPAIGKNKYFFLLMAFFTLLYIMATGAGSVTYYYCNIILEDVGLISIISGCSIVTLLIINFFVPSLTKRFGRRKCMIAGTLGCAVGYSLIGMGGTTLPLVVAGVAVKGMSLGILFSTGYAMTADVVDYGDWKTGVRSEGLLVSCVSFGTKVGTGLGPAIAAWLLAMAGYDGMAKVQTETAKFMIRFSFGWFGLILALMIVVVVFFMNIEKDAPQMREDLEKRRQG